MWRNPACWQLELLIFYFLYLSVGWPCVFALKHNLGRRKLAVWLRAPTGPLRRFLALLAVSVLWTPLLGKLAKSGVAKNDSGTGLKLNRNLAVQLQERCVTDLSFAWMRP